MGGVIGECEEEWLLRSVLLVQNEKALASRSEEICGVTAF